MANFALESGEWILESAYALLRLVPNTWRVYRVKSSAKLEMLQNAKSADH